MTRHLTYPHELARAALDTAIQLGQVAHHSGRADDFYRARVKRIREVSGAARSTTGIVVELHDTADGRVRAIIDSDAGIWDSIIPAADARRIRERVA